MQWITQKLAKNDLEKLLDDKILRMAEISETPCAVDIANELSNLNLASVHPNTVRNRLKEKNLHGRAMVKKPLLLPRHCKARFEFAKMDQNWTEEAWSWTWKRSDEALKSKHVKKQSSLISL